MSQPALFPPEFDFLPSPSPTLRSASTVLTFPQTEDRETPLADGAAGGGSCLKGLGFAVGIEAGAALCFYGAWQLWKILR